jgi:hypothetical protein
MDALLALDDRLLRVDVDDGGSTTALTGRNPERLATTGGATLVGTFDDGLWRAADAGYERVAPGTLPDRVTALAVAPSDPATVYLGTEPSAVYRTDDGGEPSDARRVSSAERRESDGGGSWRECSPLTDLSSADRWSFPPRTDTLGFHFHRVQILTHSQLYVLHTRT